MDKVQELQVLIKELREKFEEKQKGLLSAAEFKEFETKVNERIDQLETMIKRPPISSESKGDKEPNNKKAAFFRFMREGKGALSPEEKKALVSDDTGQILIPEEIEAEIYRELPQISVVRGLATVRTTNSNRVRRRSLTEVQVGWGKLETGASLVESDMEPAEDYIYIEDLYGLTKIGEDELMDTDVALESIVVDSFSRAVAEAEDNAFIAGTGHSNGQPEGILNGNIVERVDAGQSGAISADDMLKLIYEVPAQYRQNGVFIVNSKTELALRLLKDANEQYLWQPSLQAGRPNTFAGYPIYNQEAVPDIPEAGNAGDVAIFGDIRAGYQIRDRMGLSVQRLVELYAESGLVGFKAHFRVGGGVVRPNAIRVLRVPSA